MAVHHGRPVRCAGVGGPLADRIAPAPALHRPEGLHASFRWGHRIVVVWWDGAALVVLGTIGLALLVEAAAFVIPLLLPWIPETYRRFKGRYVTPGEAGLHAVLFIFAASCALQTALITSLTPDRRLAIILGLTWMFSLGGVLTTMWIVAHRRSQRRVREATGLLCMNCRYSLLGLESSGRCPECNAPYQAARLRDHWRRRYGEVVPPEDSDVPQPDPRGTLTGED